MHIKVIEGTDEYFFPDCVHFAPKVSTPVKGRGYSDTIHHRVSTDLGLWKASVVECVTVDLAQSTVQVFFTDSTEKTVDVSPREQRSLHGREWGAECFESHNITALLEVFNSCVLPKLDMPITTEIWMMEHQSHDLEEKVCNAKKEISNLQTQRRQSSMSLMTTREEVARFLPQEGGIAEAILRVPPEFLNSFLRGLDTDIANLRDELQEPYSKQGEQAERAAKVRRTRNKLQRWLTIRGEVQEVLNEGVLARTARSMRSRGQTKAGVARTDVEQYLKMHESLDVLAQADPAPWALLVSLTPLPPLSSTPLPSATSAMNELLLLY